MKNVRLVWTPCLYRPGTQDMQRLTIFGGLGHPTQRISSNPAFGTMVRVSGVGDADTSHPLRRALYSTDAEAELAGTTGSPAAG